MRVPDEQDGGRNHDMSIRSAYEAWSGSYDADMNRMCDHGRHYRTVAWISLSRRWCWSTSDVRAR